MSDLLNDAQIKLQNKIVDEEYNLAGILCGTFKNEELTTSPETLKRNSTKKLAKLYNLQERLMSSLSVITQIKSL